MKPVNKQILKSAAEKMMFTMEDSQYETLLEEFDILLKQIDFMGEINGIDDAEPMIFPFDVFTSHLREDEIEFSLTQEEAMKNSGDVKDGQIRLPKVVR